MKHFLTKLSNQDVNVLQIESLFLWTKNYVGDSLKNI